MKNLNINHLIVALALVADVALVINVIRHWDDGGKPHISVNCASDKSKIIYCMVQNEDTE